jgi:hypothetical protein
MSVRGNRDRGLPALAPPDVRYASISDQSFATPRMTQRANGRHRAVSFDHLVGGGEQDGRYGEAQRFSGFEVNHQFELLRPLYR